MDNQRALENVIATMAIENMALSDDEIELLKRYQNGELTHDEYNAEVLKSIGVKHG